MRARRLGLKATIGTRVVDTHVRTVDFKGRKRMSMTKTVQVGQRDVRDRAPIYQSCAWNTYVIGEDTICTDSLSQGVS